MLRTFIGALLATAAIAQGADRPENFVQWRDGLASSAQPTAAWLGTVGEQKYEVLVNLAPPQSMGSIANEGGIVSSKGVKYVNIPVDFMRPTAEDFRFFSEVMKAAEKMPAEHYSFRPTDDVRSYAEVLGHIADATYGICGGAIGKKGPEGSVEKTKKTKPEVMTALKDAFTFCDEVWAGMTSAKMLETAKMFGGEKTRVSILDFNTGHTYEHYGNLSTYLRMKKIVPPSSEEAH